MKFCRLLASIALALPLCVNAQNYPPPGVDQSAPVSGDTFYGPFPKEIPDGKTPDGKADEEQPFDLFECYESVGDIFGDAKKANVGPKGAEKYHEVVAAGAKANNACVEEARRRGGQISGSGGLERPSERELSGDPIVNSELMPYSPPAYSPPANPGQPADGKQPKPVDYYNQAMMDTLEGRPPPSTLNLPYEEPAPGGTSTERESACNPRFQDCISDAGYQPSDPEEQAQWEEFKRQNMVPPARTYETNNQKTLMETMADDAIETEKDIAAINAGTYPRADGPTLGAGSGVQCEEEPWEIHIPDGYQCGWYYPQVASVGGMRMPKPRIDRCFEYFDKKKKLCIRKCQSTGRCAKY